MPTSTTYIELVNTLRDRFNEVHLTSANWNTVVGFDQFTKDAINYAYSDILNAEMEWPFLHVKSTLQTVPGVQLYPVNTNNADVIKEIDWDSFFIAPNDVVTQIANEPATIPATGAMVIAPAQLASWSSHLSIVRVSTSIGFDPVDRDPQANQYTIKDGSYYFNVADAGVPILINYITSANSTINVSTASHLSYMDYDTWRSTRLEIDLNDTARGSYSKPQWVFKTQSQGEIGLSPVPDKIYIVNFETWVDSADLDATTDMPIIPERFFQVILDGAAKYCYEFREDPQMAASADKRFVAGVARMRIELINRQTTMNAGMRYYPHGFSYTLNTG
jgi:hypothetical protein